MQFWGRRGLQRRKQIAFVFFGPLSPLSAADQPTPHRRNTLSIARYYGEEMTEDSLTDPLNALDLRNRNITSIADGGLGCYTMQTVMMSTSNVNVARLRQAALLALLK